MPPQIGTEKSSTGTSAITPADIVRKMRYEYTYASKQSADRIIDGLNALLLHFSRPKLVVRELLQDAAKLINRQLRIKEVCIGVRSPVDGLYKYEVMAGMREFVWAQHKLLSYELKDFEDGSEWGGAQISPYSRIFLVEQKPYLDNEKGTYDHQLSLRMKRRTLYDSVEGDYLDVHIFGKDKQLLGWIEISGTWDGKLPDAQLIRWLEFISNVLGIALIDWDGK